MLLRRCAGISEERCEPEPEGSPSSDRLEEEELLDPRDLENEPREELAAAGRTSQWIYSLLEAIFATTGL